jgi:hypothetical protein
MTHISVYFRFIASHDFHATKIRVSRLQPFNISYRLPYIDLLYSDHLILNSKVFVACVRIDKSAVYILTAWET